MLEVNIIQSLHHLSKQHVGNSYDDRNFHLQRVNIVDLSLSAIPCRVNSNWVNAISIFHLAISILITRVK